MHKLEGTMTAGTLIPAEVVAEAIDSLMRTVARDLKMHADVLVRGIEEFHERPVDGLDPKFLEGVEVGLIYAELGAKMMRDYSLRLNIEEGSA